MYRQSLKYISAVVSIAGLLSATSALADIQQLVPVPLSAPTVTPVTRPSPIGCYDFTANLRAGARGIAVRHLQYALMREGFDIPQEEFGNFGNATAGGVSAFQQKYSSDILVPTGLTQGNGFVGKRTRARLNALYSCDVAPVTQVIQSYTTNTTPPAATPPAQVQLAVTNITLDSNGLGATFCNKGNVNLPTAPFRIRLNGINRDFEVTGTQKAGACETDTIPYGTFGLSYDPGSTFTAIAIIDPNAYYKTASNQFPLNTGTSLAVPAIQGAQLTVRSVLIKTTGIQATLCNLGTSDLTTFPVRVTVNGTNKDFDVSAAYKKGSCVPTSWTYDNWGTTYTPGVTYAVSITTDPNKVINDTNQFDNTATAIGIP